MELKDKLDDFAVAPAVATSVQGAAVDDVLSALVNLGYQRPAAEKAIEQAIAKDKDLAGDFDAQWNDDGHHALHVVLTGEHDGYYVDYADDTAARLARYSSPLPVNPAP